MSYEYVLDSSAWVEWLGDTEKALKIERLVQGKTTASSIMALAEIADKCARENASILPIVLFMQKNTALLPISLDIAME